MISPYKFRETLYYDSTNPLYDKAFLAKKIFEHFQNISKENIALHKNKVNLITFSSLFSLEHPVEVLVQSKKEPKVSYSINFGEVYKIILMILLFALFFVKFSWWIYSIIAVFFSIAVVTANIHYVNSYIKRNIIAALSGFATVEETHISSKQKSWIKDPQKCPACGEEVNKYTTKCTNCGLKIGGKKSAKISNSTDPNIEVTYILKKESNEKNSR